MVHKRSPKSKGKLPATRRTVSSEPNGKKTIKNSKKTKKVPKRKKVKKEQRSPSDDKSKSSTANSKSSQRPSNSVFRDALKLHGRGYWIVPCDGKKPITKNWQSIRLTEQELREYLKGSDLNIALVLNKSDLIDIECDSEAAEAKLLKIFKDAGLDEIPLTPTYKSKRGFHRLFNRPKGLPDKAVIKINGIEFRIGNGKGALSILPPSTHPNGPRYKWDKGKSLFTVPPTELPQKIVELLKSKGKSASKSAESGSIAKFIPEGNRNTELTRFAGAMRRLGASKENIQSALTCHNKERCTPPLPQHEVDSIAGNISGYEPSSPHLSTCRPVDPSKAPKQVPRFPVEVLPAPLANLVNVASKALPCPTDFIAVPMLAVLGTAIGSGHRVEIKQGWSEGACIFSAVVAPTGTKKTPAQQLVVGPITRIQKQLNAMFREEKAAYTANSNANNTNQESLIHHQIVTTDTTTEALVTLMNSNPRGILLCQDELASWTRSLGQYKGGRGNDRQHWLSAWSGSLIIVNRKGKPPLSVDAPFISVVGGIQPAVLGELTDRDGRDDGLIPRVLMAYPDSIPVKYSENVVDTGVVGEYHHFIENLVGHPIDMTHCHPKTLHFSSRGKKQWVKWIEGHHEGLNHIQNNLRGAWAKMDGYCARLALLIHRCRYVSGETTNKDIDAKSVIGAAKLIDYFKGHARRVYEKMARDSDKSQLGKACNWIRSKGGTVTAREIQRAKICDVKDSDDAKDLLKDLADAGFGKMQKSDRGQLKFTLHD